MAPNEERRDHVWSTAKLPAAFQAQYHHVLLTVYQAQELWMILLCDPFGTNQTGQTEGTESDAKAYALALADGYLKSKYPDMRWPILDDRVHWAQIQT